MLPETNLRYFPRRLVPLALEAGWVIHPESKPGDWAVIMVHEGVPVPPLPQPIRGSTKSQGARSRNLVRYAGAA